MPKTALSPISGTAGLSASGAAGHSSLGVRIVGTTERAGPKIVLYRQFDNLDMQVLSVGTVHGLPLSRRDEQIRGMLL